MKKSLKNTDEDSNTQQSQYRKKVNQTNTNNFTKAKKTLQEKFGLIKYALCDEYSMVGKSMLSAFHRSLSIANSCQFGNSASEDQINNSIPFGGVNLIYFGDILQYKPVKDQPLYTPVHSKIQDKNDKTQYDNTKKSSTVTADKFQEIDSDPNYLEYAMVTNKICSGFTRTNENYRHFI